MKNLLNENQIFRLIFIALISFTTVILHPSAVSFAQPAGLVSWWPGEDNANDIVGSNHGTLMNGATFATGKYGQAFRFDGIDDYILSSTTGMPIGNNDRTLVLWAKMDAFLYGEAFFAGYGNMGGYNQVYVLGATGNIPFFSQWGSSVTGPSLNAGQWYHVAVTTIGNYISLYLDGQLVNTGTITINTPSNTEFYIGKIPGPLGNYRKLQGMIDEVQIYNRALSSSEIQNIYYLECPQIVVQPLNQAVTEGKEVSFNAEASGTPTPTLQWQVSTDNGTNFDNISGATSNTLTFNAGCSDNGNKYRTVFTNSCGSTATDEVLLTVNDEQAPTITVTVSPTTLWPPNNQMKTITATVTVDDNCGDVTYVLTSITSNEDINNDVANATIGTDDLSFDLRAKRNGNGNGRIYTITYTATDASGNTATGTATVTVPHDNSKLGFTTDDYNAMVNLQSYPNPFTDETTIEFTLPEQSAVTVKVYNLQGNLVNTLHDGMTNAGLQMLKLNTRNFPAGEYTIVLTFGSEQFIHKIMKEK